MVMSTTFKQILQQTQPNLKEILHRYLIKKDYTPISGDGFLYAKGDIPIMLVAHMDTVHKDIPEEIFFDKEQMVMWCPDGIGGDDRCGVYAIVHLMYLGYRPHILFTEDEELGCVGAKKCVQELDKPDVKFIIEIDRRGEDDCVFYDCDNKKFIEYIETFGFKKAWGSSSDIRTLSDAWEVASVNLSSGYYNEHTNREYIKLNQLDATIEKVKKILDDDSEDKPYYDYQKKTYSYYNYNYNTYNSKNKTYNYKKGKNETDCVMEPYDPKIDTGEYYTYYGGCIYYEKGYYDDHGVWKSYEDI